MESQKNIVHVTEEIIKSWKEKKYDRAYFLTGHALHMIQDSFSQAHTLRDATDSNHLLKEVCYYSEEPKLNPVQGQICFHKPLDPRDGIWILKGPEDKNFNPAELNEQQKRDALISEARWARTASVYYLFFLAKRLQSAPNPETATGELQKTLKEELFIGFQKDLHPEYSLMKKGILNCGGLSKKTVELEKKE